MTVRFAPPRRTALLMGCLHAFFAAQWWAAAPARSSGPTFDDLRWVGATVLRGACRPMFLWAALFTVCASITLAGVWLRRAHLAAAGCYFAAPLLFVYGVLNGIAAGDATRVWPPGSTHVVHAGTYVVAALCTYAAVQNAFNARTLWRLPDYAVWS